MQQVENGDIVIVTQKGTLDNGTVFESIQESNPKTILMGGDDTPKAIQRHMKGMRAGEMRKIRIEAEDGEYGIRRGDLLHIIPRNQFNNKIEPKVGMLLSMNLEKNGVAHQVPATIVELSPETITIDYNHPLAGHPLNYEIKILEIQKQ